MDEITEAEATEAEATEAEATEAEATEAEATEAEATEAIISAYEEKITNLISNYENKLIEQNRIIKQLINGEPTSAAETIADKINKKREIKIW